LILDFIKARMRQFMERGDKFLLIVCTICSLISVYAVYLATKGMAAGGVEISPLRYTVVQLVSVFLGVFTYIAFTFIDADILGDNWKILSVINVLLMVALIFIGSEDGTGNKAWIRFGPIGIQPSEIVKIFYIIVSAKQMTYLREHADINSFFSIVQMGAHLLAVFGMVLVISSDLGSAAILLAIFVLMFFALCVKGYWFAIAGAAVAAVIPFAWNFVLKEYQKQRLIAPYNPSIDPTGYGITWQTTQSKLSLASGMLTGISEGTRETVFTGKHTDFIFACIGEHFGFIGCMVVIVLLTIIIVHCFRAALHCSRLFDMLVCMGITGAVVTQTFINIGMCIGITPVIGITLPFFSYGGSSMVTMYMAMGIISGIKFKPKPQHFALSS